MKKSNDFLTTLLFTDRLLALSQPAANADAGREKPCAAQMSTPAAGFGTA